MHYTQDIYFLFPPIKIRMIPDFYMMKIIHKSKCYYMNMMCPGSSVTFFKPILALLIFLIYHRLDGTNNKTTNQLAHQQQEGGGLL